MKILHVLTAPRAEGTPKLVLDWLSISDIEQNVLFLKNNPNDLVKDFEYTNVKLYYCEGYGLGWKKYHQAYYQVKEKLQLIKPDLLICWTQGMANSVVIAAKKSGVKSLVHFGCTPSYANLRQILYNYFINFTLLIANSNAVCASQHIKKVAQILPFIPSKLFHKANNSFRVEKFVRKPLNNQRRIKTGVMVGNLEPVKNHNMLIEAWSLIIQRGFNYRLLLVGDGSLRNKLHEQVMTYGINDYVEFTGPVNNVEIFLQKSSVFVFPTSAQEGFGTVLLEALASGLKVVASDVPACREVLQNGKYGVLVPPKDSEALAEAILQAFREPLDEHKLTAQVEYAKQFTPENMMRQYLEIAGFGEEAKKLGRINN